MTAPVPQDQFASAKGAHIEEQLDIPAIISVSPDQTDATTQAEAKKAAEASAYDADFLSLEELLEQVKIKKPDADIDSVRKVFESINETSNGKMGIPRTVEGAALDNADLALELHGLTQLKPAKSMFSKTLQTVFTSASDNGTVKVREGVVAFHAGRESVGGLFKKKEFTQDDARQIALLAMHNKDMLPPNAIKITGTKTQRDMIKAELDKLNEVLPQTRQFALTAKQEKELGALNTARPEAAAPEVSSAVNEARLAALAATDKDAPAHEDTDAKYDLAEAMSATLTEDRENVLANSKQIGQLAKFGNDAYETIFHDADSGHDAFIQFADLGEERGLKVIRIEPTDQYPGYQSTPYVVLDRTDGVPLSPDLAGEPVVKTPLAGNFDAAGSGKPLTQSHPDFIGPREFVGPRPQASGPTPPSV